VAILAELFEGFKRGVFGEGPLATAAGHKVNGFPDGHGRAKVQAHTAVITDGAGDVLEAIGHVGLRAEIKLHIGIDRKAVKALLTDTPPFAVRLHEPLIDAEAGLLADGALYVAQSLFDLLDRQWRHERYLLHAEYNALENLTATEGLEVMLDLQAILSNTDAMYQITDTLFVGNIYEAEKPPAHIGAVLLVAEEFTPNPPAGVIYERIPFKEFGEAKPASLDQAIEWIARHHPDNRVLVCCRAGMGRSVSVVMAYLCCVHNMAYPDVLQLIMTRRPAACPLPNIQATIQQVHQLRQTRI